MYLQVLPKQCKRRILASGSFLGLTGRNRYKSLNIKSCHRHHCFLFYFLKEHQAQWFCPDHFLAAFGAPHFICSICAYFPRQNGQLDGVYSALSSIRPLHPEQTSERRFRHAFLFKFSPFVACPLTASYPLPFLARHTTWLSTCHHDPALIPVNLKHGTKRDFNKLKESMVEQQ